MTGMMCYLTGIWLLMILNNYWYLLCKMLLNEKTVYLLLPLAVYSLLAIAEFIPEGNPISTFTMNLGRRIYRRKSAGLSECHYPYPANDIHQPYFANSFAL